MAHTSLIRAECPCILPLPHVEARAKLLTKSMQT